MIGKELQRKIARFFPCIRIIRIITNETVVSSPVRVTFADGVFVLQRLEDGGQVLIGRD